MNPSAAPSRDLPPLLLASRSRHRSKLLESLLQPVGLSFTTQPADIDETPLRNELPLAYVTRMARTKAETLHRLNPSATILAADTPVILGRSILQTPGSEAEARAMLQRQSGRKVRVPTVVALATPAGDIWHEVSDNWLKFKVLSEDDISRMLASGHWQHCSGALQVEDCAADAWIKTMYGSLSGIIGLPLYETAKLLRRAGYRV